MCSIHEFGTDLISLKTAIIALQTEVRTTNSNMSTSSTSYEHFEEIIQKMIKRENRKGNVMIFGIKEREESIKKPRPLKVSVSY